MPKTKEERKEYMRLYYLKNKETKKENNKLWRQKNKGYIKEYRQTEQGKKSNIIGKWRHLGILCFNFDLLYDIFLKTTNCEFCNVKLTTGRYMTSTTKCLDHDHSINDMFNVRGVLCQSCNIKDVLK